MPKFQIEGIVYLTDRFLFEVEAEDEAAARRAAKRQAWKMSWPGAKICQAHIQVARDAALLDALNASARREQFADEPRSTVFDAELDELEDGFENEDSNNAE